METGSIKRNNISTPVSKLTLGTILQHKIRTDKNKCCQNIYLLCNILLLLISFLLKYIREDQSICNSATQIDR